MCNKKLASYALLSCFAFMCALLGPAEVYAFSQPIVSKVNSVKDQLLMIAKASVGVGIIVFLFSLIANRPMWKFCISLIVVGVLLGAFGAVSGYFVNA